MKYNKLTLGQIEAVLNRLGGIEGARAFLSGKTEVVAIKTHIIDCDSNPYIPGGFEIAKHIKGGQLNWNSDEVELWLCDKQKEQGIGGSSLYELLKDKSVLNACVLDHLLANPQLIPEEWKDETVFFWGTIYRESSGGNLYVRFLYYHGGEWKSRKLWFENNSFGCRYHAALSCK